MIYAWHCASCHHEWQAVKDHGSKCPWCGDNSALLGVDKSEVPAYLCHLLVVKERGV